jgi:aminoglycoside 6'-N-acetyltransferase I
MHIIEELNKNNLLQAAQLSLELWPGSRLDEMTTHYEEVLQSDTATCFLLHSETGYFGFIELSVRNDYVEGAEDLPVAYVEGIFVNKLQRLKGFGFMLVKHAEDWARAKGFKQLCSDTELENTSGIRFHVAAGFSEISTIVCFTKNLD